MSIIFKALSSKNTTYLILLSWFLTIFYSWWFIHPRVDDGIYLVQSISVLNNHPPGAIFGDSITPLFFTFPTQPFFHGIFLKILDFFFININVETYRLFNYFSLITLFYLTYKIFFTIFNNTNHQRFAGNISLLLLGFSQFSLQFYVNRPEILGLVFFMLGLIYFIKILKGIKNIKLSIAISFFFFGMSSITHPNFLLLISFCIAYWGYYVLKTRNISYLKYSISFFIPIIVLLIWFLMNFNAVSDQLFNRAAEVASSTSVKGLQNIFYVILGDAKQSFIHNLYLQLHMLTFLLTLLCIIYYLFRKNNKIKYEFYIHNFFKIFSLSLFFLLLIMIPFRPYFLLISFLSIIILTFFITSNYISYSLSTQTNSTLVKNNLFLGLIYLVVFSIPLSLVAMHSIKMNLSNETFENHHKTIDKIKPFLASERHIFITTAQLLPLFADQISKDFYNISKFQKEIVHWYFPVADSASVDFREMINNDIIRDIPLMQNAVWGSLKKGASFSKNNQTACLSLKGTKKKVHLLNPKTIYEDRKNIFLIAASVIVAKSCDNT